MCSSLQLKKESDKFVTNKNIFKIFFKKIIFLDWFYDWIDESQKSITNKLLKISNRFFLNFTLNLFNVQ